MLHQASEENHRLKEEISTWKEKGSIDVSHETKESKFREEIAKKDEEIERLQKAAEERRDETGEERESLLPKLSEVSP